MSVIKADLEPSFVLHSRPYRDTSLLVELLTQHYGRLTVVARGVRAAKSKLAGVLMPFLPLLISFKSKGELGNLQQAELNGLRYDLKNKVLLSGFYLNELLMKLLPRHESYPNIYQAYKDTLFGLVNSKQPEVELRLFEKCLLSNIGYGLQLHKTITDEEVHPEEYYQFEFGSGLVKATSENQYNYSGKGLLALQNGKFSDASELQDAKRLLRGVLSELLGNKRIKSRELFR